MSGRRNTPAQVVRTLREADRLLSEGFRVAGGLRHLGIAEVTYHRWRDQYGGMKSRRRETAKGARVRESEAQADRRGSGFGYPGAQGAVRGETFEPGPEAPCGPGFAGAAPVL